MRSGLTVSEDGVSGTSRVSWPLVRVGALLALVLEMDLVLLTDFDLLDVLGLLEGLLKALAAGLRVLVPLVTAAIDASEWDGVWSKISVLYETLE